MLDVPIFERRLGFTIKEKSYFQEAITHRSYLNEHRGYKLPHNERLEFLGDAVLELIVTENLFHQYDRPEGEMTAWRALQGRAQQSRDLPRGRRARSGAAREEGEHERYISSRA